MGSAGRARREREAPVGGGCQPPGGEGQTSLARGGGRGPFLWEGWVPAGWDRRGGGGRRRTGAGQPGPGAVAAGGGVGEGGEVVVGGVEWGSGGAAGAGPGSPWPRAGATLATPAASSSSRRSPPRGGLGASSPRRGTSDPPTHPAAPGRAHGHVSSHIASSDPLTHRSRDQELLEVVDVADSRESAPGEQRLHLVLDLHPLVSRLAGVGAPPRAGSRSAAPSSVAVGSPAPVSTRSASALASAIVSSAVRWASSRVRLIVSASSAETALADRRRPSSRRRSTAGPALRELLQPARCAGASAPGSPSPWRRSAPYSSAFSASEERPPPRLGRNPLRGPPRGTGQPRIRLAQAGSVNPSGHGQPS